MKRRFDVDTQLVKGKNGVFEVSLGDSLLFSKKSLGRFPEDGEVEKLLAEALG
ncbi:MAG: Rdx family protein [Thermoanaerobaculia bacterium]|nr:Rdx family protein [Thermoanaerobaculia bacterium]